MTDAVCSDTAAPNPAGNSGGKNDCSGGGKGEKKKCGNNGFVHNAQAAS